MRYPHPLRFPPRTKSFDLAVLPNRGCPESGPHRHNERARVELVFHSLAAATPGVRSAAHCQRHLLYRAEPYELDRKSTRLNSSHGYISYAVFCLKKKKQKIAAFVLNVLM